MEFIFEDGRLEKVSHIIKYRAVNAVEFIYQPGDRLFQYNIRNVQHRPLIITVKNQ
jgi:hypothetical protein